MPRSASPDGSAAAPRPRWRRAISRRRTARRAWTDDGPGPWLRFTATATLVGILTGVVAAGFRVALHWVELQRESLLRWGHPHPWAFPLVVALGAAATAAAASLVHRIEPHAEGSGIPRVESIVAGKTEPGGPLITPIKFVGGLLAIGSGLALGREGPSVQMGGSIASVVAGLTHRNQQDLRILIAAGAAAGLATAFNAPIAGGVFVLEELVKRFDPRTTVATLIASAAGFTSAHLIVGDTHVFLMPTLAPPRLLDAPAVAAVGVVTGLLGVLYNRAVIAGLNATQRSRMPVEARAGLIGALAMAVAWYAPSWVGGGDHLTQNALLGWGTLAGLTAVLAFRFLFGVVSYAAATPGGLFAPMLVLGTHIGAATATFIQLVAPSHLFVDRAGLALIGMAAFFTATVRAPVTGIILATEMTGTTVMLAPMLGACALAMIIAGVLRSEPIYDALARRSAAAAAANRELRDAKQ